MSANEKYAVCEVCGKPCGAPVVGGQVYHWKCAFEIMRETREQIQRERSEVRNIQNEICISK